jgi:hypothetical protein
MELNSRCAVCGHGIEIDKGPLHRELQICANCGSCPRFCGLAFGVNKLLHDEPPDRPLCDLSEFRTVNAIGVSDDDRLARVFQEKFSYTNTFFHTDPKLDICSRESCSGYRADLIICSDVIEHTVSTPIVPLSNLYNMLTPGGGLVLSAPTFLFDSTIEWYGGMVEMEVSEEGGRHIVRWRNKRSTQYVDTDPVFHGGPGQVLELRLISHSELLAVARSVGFVGGTLEFAPEWGYLWPITRQLPYIEACADGRVMLLNRPSCGS